MTDGAPNRSGRFVISAIRARLIAFFTAPLRPTHGAAAWDSAWLLSDSSLVGKALHTLIGYTDQPTAMQLTVYLAILPGTFVLMRLYGTPPRAMPRTARS